MKQLLANANVKTLLSGGFSAFCIRVAGVALCYGLHAVLARVMGADPFGVYACALAWLAVAAIPARLGFDTGLLRLLAAYADEKQFGLMRGLLRRATGLAAGSGALIAAVGAVVLVLVLWGRMEMTLWRTLLVGAPMVPLLAVIVLRQAAIQSQRRILTAYIPDQIVRPIVIGAGAAAIVMSGRTLNAANVVAVEVVAAGVAMVVGAGLLRAALPRDMWTAKPDFRTREWLRICLPMMLIGGLTFLLGQVDVLMVSLLIDTTQAGIYSAAVKTAVLLSFALVAVNAMLAPMISVLHNSGDIDELQRVVRAASLVAIWLTLLPFIGLLVFAEPVMALFGPEFVVGRWPLIILAGGQLVNAMSGSVSLLLTMTGHEAECARVISWSAIVNVTLNLGGILLWGLEGAAVATSVTLILQNLWLMRLVQRLVGVRSTVLLG